MEQDLPHPPVPDAAYCVRRNAGPAGLAAALLLFFGFYYLARPSGSDLFSIAALVFYYTLRIGGIAMAIVALWSLSGHTAALFVDAIVSVAIGVMLLLTGLGLLTGGDLLQTVLNVVIGGMFISAGWRSGRDYFGLARTASQARPTGAQRTGLASEYDGDQGGPRVPGHSLATQLRQTRANSRDSDSLPVADMPREPAVPARPPTPPAEADQPDASASDEQREKHAEPDSDGFLASFADDGPPPST